MKLQIFQNSYLFSHHHQEPPVVTFRTQIQMGLTLSTLLTCSTRKGQRFCKHTHTLPHTIHITQHTDIPYTTNTTDTSYSTQIDLPYISHIIQKHHKYHILYIMHHKTHHTDYHRHFTHLTDTSYNT